MRHVWIAVLLAACGGDTETPVGELSNESQINLCEYFVDVICANADFAAFCGDTCHRTSCTAAAASGDIAAACDTNRSGDPITAEDVDACATTGDAATCQAGGGNCMFDAITAACTGT